MRKRQIMTASITGLSTGMHALDADLVHLSLHNLTNRLLFYVTPLVIPVNGVLPAAVFQDAADESLPEAQRWPWRDLTSLAPGQSISTAPIRLPANNWGAVRYVTLQPLEGVHKPHHPVISNAVPLNRP